MVLTPIAKHTSSLTPFCYALSLLVAPARRLETDESAVARYVRLAYEIFFRLPRIGIISAPIDQKFGIVPSVNSLALYLLDDPLLVGSFEFSSQPLFVEELVAHYTRIRRYTHSHGKGGEILKLSEMVYEMR